MSTTPQAVKGRVAPEIAATLAGRRFGLFGFEASSSVRISAILRQAGCLCTPFEEVWLGDAGQLGDALLLRLGGASPQGLRAAAASCLPVLLVGPADSVLEGEAGAYGWAGDLLAEPWPDAELLVRLFRLLAPAREYGSQAGQRSQPLLLLADDDPAWISLAEATLRTHGLSCRTATDGLSTLRLSRQLLPDLLVLDLRMPDIDGFEVLQTIRREPLLSTLPVALLTGCDQDTEVARATELHADDYLIKPLSPTVLLNRVRRLLAAAPRRKSPGVAPVSGEWRVGAGGAVPAAGKGV